MNPSTVNAAAAALLQGRKPGLPSRPSRKLLHAVVDTAARAAPAAGTTPATVLHTFRRQLGTAAAFLPDPILLAAVSAAARRFSAGSVAVDPAFPWLSLLLEGTPADAPAATAITSAPSALARAAALPSRNLIAVDPANCPGTLSANHELHLAAWWTCPSGSVAVWTHDATPPETAPAATPLPSASALSTLLAGYRPAQRNSALNVPRRIADAVRRADASFSGVQQVSASPIPLPPRREGIWVPWQPSFRYWLSAVPAGGPQLDSLPPHPTPLSIPSSLQDLQPPTPAAFTIPKSLLRSNALSDAQFEAYALASSALQTAIPRQSGPQPARKGFLVADSTGSGKGRILAALLASAWGQGSRRAIWISSTPDLIADARRDWSDINGDPDLIIPLDPGNLPRHDGILFASYAALRNDSTRTNLVAWLRRAEPDGNPSPTIVFDESHTTASATSAQARSARILQHRIPDARVVYASATATRNTVSWIFGDRLALWESPDTCFDGPLDLIEHLHPHGLSALQILFRHASGHGAAITRSLRLDDVPFQPLECPLDRAQKQTQTNWSRAWRLALIAYMKAYRASHPKPAAGPNPPSAKRQAFDEAHGIETNSNIPANAITALRQAFFRSLITSFKTKRLIRAIEKDIAEGRQAVIQLESTLETHAARAIARYAEQEGWTPETGHPLYLPDDVDISPAGDIARRARDAFVVHKMEPDPDSDPANPTLRPALDANGDPIPSPRSIIARDRAFRALSRHHTPVPLLDALVMHFGDDLAEVTGRTTRVETAPPDAFGRTTVVRSRSHHDATREADDFQAGIRRVLVFSAAGSTGRSYHDDTQNPVAAQRVHYVVQPSWDTPTLIQGLGRTHRSNQRTPPILRLVTTDLAGEIRYVANASSNIERMGASNRAHTKAQTSMRFEDLPRFDTRPARQALADLTQRATFTGLPGMSTREFTDVTGIVDSTRATIPFLNRLLTLTPDHQKLVYGEFLKQYRRQVQLDELQGYTDHGIAGYRHPILRNDPPVSYSRRQTLIPFHSCITRADTAFAEDVIDAFESLLPGNNPGSFTKPSFFIANPTPDDRVAALILPESPWQESRPDPAVLLVSPAGVSLLRATGRFAGGAPRINNPATNRPYPLLARDPCATCVRKDGKTTLTYTKLDTLLSLCISSPLLRPGSLVSSVRHRNAVYTPRFLVYGDLLADWKQLTSANRRKRRPASCAAFNTPDGFRAGLVLSLADLLLLHHPGNEQDLPSIPGRLPSEPPPPARPRSHSARNPRASATGESPRPLPTLPTLSRNMSHPAP